MTSPPTASLGAFARRRTRALPGWAALVGLAALGAVPVLAIAWSVVDPSTEVWRQLWRTRLPGMILDTSVLLATVVTASTVLGTALAWLVSTQDFRGRRLVGWLLVVPLAVPGYVLGFVWLDTLQGPLGARGVRNIWVCAATLTLSLYPYVYLLARAAFSEQSANPAAVARSLGCSPWQAWWLVNLPLARPALAAGAALVGMEVLTDVGTVRLFNVNTVADGVLRVWFDTGNRDAAAELATLLMAAAAGLIVGERVLRRRARYQQPDRREPAPPSPITSRTAWTALLVGLGVVASAVGVPLIRLVAWAAEARRSGQTVVPAGDVWFHLGATARVAIGTTVVCGILGIGLASLTRRRGRSGQAIGRVATLGYAVPGPVVAVGVVVTLAALDRRGWFPDGFLLVGSFVGLVYALTVRFLAVSYQGVESSLAKVPASVTASAHALGAGSWHTATRVELPLVRNGLLAAGALVAVDSIKELPVTLLLRPFGTDTLSVWVWQATSESLWVQAAVPSLAVITIGMIPVAVLMWAIERGVTVTS